MELKQRASWVDYSIYNQIFDNCDACEIYLTFDIVWAAFGQHVFVIRSFRSSGLSTIISSIMSDNLADKIIVRCLLVPSIHRMRRIPRRTSTEQIGRRHSMIKEIFFFLINAYLLKVLTIPSTSFHMHTLTPQQSGNIVVLS